MPFLIITETPKGPVVTTSEGGGQAVTADTAVDLAQPGSEGTAPRKRSRKERKRPA